MRKTKLTLCFIILFILSFSVAYGENPNLYVNNIKIENMDNIDESLISIENEILNNHIVITYVYEDKNTVLTYKLKDLGFKLDKVSMINDIYNSMYYNTQIGPGGHVHLKNHYIVDEQVFLSALAPLDEIPIPPMENAKLHISKGTITIIPEVNSFEFDKIKLMENIKAASLTGKDTFRVPTKVTIAPVTTKNFENMDLELLSEFTTKYSPSNKPRSSNIAMATSYVNGTLLKPGEIFSYNDTVGKRTSERGFKIAGIYKNGKVSKGLGGGICQGSTTLYNAVLLGDLEIVDRNNHSLTVPYVPLSRDATVSWGTQDFKFKNNTDKDIYIYGSTTRNTVTFKIYGKQRDKEIKLISKVLGKKYAPVEKIEDPSLNPGEEKISDKGHTGYTSQLIKEVYENGELVDSYVVSKDYYMTTPKIIKIGTKKEASQ
ncbi:MAG: VanW family protein [Anaeromicrobium sp.]|uniref:VanW family protein n=1 Tax=Anaeromicrobium sp. TaxID=1929132 RepID=UPI0025D72B32|nr:VanW family protein [Anaeromicrobium sp.]MCT4595292.1 VanW family protein [Anaeromicrobium sp.]